ncbi:MAG TPA: hypothetical protein VIM11_21405 [Tepidisphaeraceae bacterium]
MMSHYDPATSPRPRPYRSPNGIQSAATASLKADDAAADDATPYESAAHAIPALHAPAPSPARRHGLDDLQHPAHHAADGLRPA